MTTGARYLPQFGPLGVPGVTWPERMLTVPSGALRLRAGRPLHRAFSGAQFNPTGSDLPVTDRMRTSASEP